MMIVQKDSNAPSPWVRAGLLPCWSKADPIPCPVIERYLTTALGGHVEACEDCGQWRIAYNFCRNRHCPECQLSTAAAMPTNRSFAQLINSGRSLYDLIRP